MLHNRESIRTLLFNSHPSDDRCFRVPSRRYLSITRLQKRKAVGHYNTQTCLWISKERTSHSLPSTLLSLCSALGSRPVIYPHLHFHLRDVVITIIFTPARRYRFRLLRQSTPSIFHQDNDPLTSTMSSSSMISRPKVNKPLVAVVVVASSIILGEY